MVDLHFPGAVQIVDLFRAKEHVLCLITYYFAIFIYSTPTRVKMWTASHQYVIINVESRPEQQQEVYTMPKTPQESI
ncbi:MAG: hypothetical protein LBQ48_03895 [Oscillospiraceae bacterium]|nr:hypothetical protein [Oscillospiraceae bacterium]